MSEFDLMFDFNLKVGHYDIFHGSVDYTPDIPSMLRGIQFLAYLSLLRVSFWDTAMSVVRVDVRP